MKKLKYGGLIDSKGKISDVITRSQYEERKKRCSHWHIAGWEKRTLLLVGIMFILMVQIIGLWTIDISVGAIIASATSGQEFVLTNGFMIRDPMKGYHIGLWTVIITTGILITLFVYYVVRDIVKKVKEQYE